MNLTPSEIVAELDRYIIGQKNAKRAVAVALRNRYRRSRLPREIREEITPKNIILKGPTGVGKTEIARRLARLVKAPFIKIEATKYTEVGYVGRDVESMVRDLVEVAVRMVKDEKKHDIEHKVKPIVDEKLLSAIYDAKVSMKGEESEESFKAKLKEQYNNGEHDDTVIEIEVKEQFQPMNMFGGIAEINLGSMFGGMMPSKPKKKTISVKHARELLLAEEFDKHIDQDSVNTEAIRRAEEDGIIFIDEMDKIIGKSKTGSNSPDVSREGVQRDILPIVEGSTIATKYGNIKTDYILFIASGAFHVSKVSDLIPELQGRFPVLVELDSLGADDFVKILTEPQNAITEQYKKLLAVDNIDLQFTADGIEAIANVAYDQNNTLEDIGARRLHSIMEHIVEEISYDVEDDGPHKTIVIDKVYVESNFRTESRNLKKYIL